MRLNEIIPELFFQTKCRQTLMTLFICTILIPILMIGGIIYLYSYRQTRRTMNISVSRKPPRSVRFWSARPFI